MHALVLALFVATFASAGDAGGSICQSGYVLGPDDQILISASDGLEMQDRPVLIGTNGNVTLPLIGRVQAGGLTVEQFEIELNKRFSEYIRDPRVRVTVTDFRSQPVSVFGAVTSPGTLQLRGPKNLYEVLSLAGGPRETAGPTLTVSRRIENGPLALARAKVDESGGFSTAEVRLDDVVSPKGPAATFNIKPRDIITVSSANEHQIYVVGDVQKPGAFQLGAKETSSVARALSLAGGFGRTARPEKARILRIVPGQSEPMTISVNTRRVLEGVDEDVALRPDDVLVIPTSRRKVFTTYTVPATIASAVAAAIYTGTH